MSNMLKIEIFKVLKSKGLIISVLIGILLSIWVIIEAIINQNLMYDAFVADPESTGNVYFPISVYNTYIGINHTSVASSIFYFILPILAALPYGSSLVSEKKSGYIKSVIIRSGKSKYYISKFIAAFFSGVLVCIIIMTFSMIFSFMFLPNIKPDVITSTFPAAFRSNMWSNLYVHHPLVYLLLYSGIDIFYSGIFALISIASTFIADYKFTVLASPMLVYIAGSYFIDFLGLQNINPMVFLPQTQSICASDLTSILTEAVVVIMAVSIILFILVKEDVY